MSSRQSFDWIVPGPQKWKEVYGRLMLLAWWLTSKGPSVKPAVLLTAVGVSREGGVAHSFLGLSCIAACYVIRHHLQLEKPVFCSRNHAP